MQPTNSQKTLDYSPLHQSISWNDYYLELKNNASNNVLTFVTIFFIVAIIFPMICFSALFTIIAILTSSYIMMITTIPMVVFSLGVLYAAIYGFKYAYTKKIKMSNFASVNNIEYISQKNSSPYKGLIFINSANQAINEGYIFPHLNNLEIGNYSYANQNNNDNSNEYSYGYIKITMSRQLPHIILDAAGNNLVSKVTNLPIILQNNQKLSLEGDFDSYFTLYAPKDYETDALYLFTPDVMQTLITYANNYDIEIIDNELYIYGNGLFLLDNETEVKKLLNIADVVSKDLLKQSSNYADDSIGNKSIDVVAPQGNRLQSKIPYVAIVIVLLLVLFNFALVIYFNLIN